MASHPVRVRPEAGDGGEVVQVGVPPLPSPHVRCKMDGIVYRVAAASLLLGLAIGLFFGLWIRDATCPPSRGGGAALPHGRQESGPTLDATGRQERVSEGSQVQPAEDGRHDRRPSAMHDIADDMRRGDLAVTRALVRDRSSFSEYGTRSFPTEFAKAT